MSAPAMTMNPPDIEGMVDLETLIKIHEQLVQSQVSDRPVASFVIEIGVRKHCPLNTC